MYTALYTIIAGERQVTIPPPAYLYASSYVLRGFEVVN